VFSTWSQVYIRVANWSGCEQAHTCKQLHRQGLHTKGSSEWIALWGLPAILYCAPNTDMTTWVTVLQVLHHCCKTTLYTQLHTYSAVARVEIRQLVCSNVMADVQVATQCSSKYINFCWHVPAKFMLIPMYNASSMKRLWAKYLRPLTVHYYMPVLSSYVCEHAASLRVPANADSSTSRV